MAPVHEVAFELELFEWAEERLEVAGRWKGLAGRRLTRPVLTVTTESGRRKRLAALPGEESGNDAEHWRATFAWAGDPAEIGGAALEVGGSLVVDLPLPDRRRRRRRRPPAESADEALRSEVGALRGQVERLRAELAGRERELMELRARIEEDTGDEAVGAAAADQLTVEVDRLTSERDEARAELSSRLEAARGEHDEAHAELAGEVERLRGERDEAGTQHVSAVERLQAERTEADARHQAERARWQTDLDDLREAFSEAAAEAEASRERHGAEVGALQEQLRVARAEAARLAKATAAAAGPRDRFAPVTASARRAARGEPTETLETPPERAQKRPTAAPEADAAAAPEAEAAPEAAPGGGAAAVLQTLKERIGSALAAGNQARTEAAPEPTGSAPARAWARARAGKPPAPAPEPLGPPRPRRTATAARARAGATVAARRNPAEVWGMRILALVVVAAMLITLLLLVTSLA